MLHVRANRKLYYTRTDCLTVSYKSRGILGRSAYPIKKILCGCFVVFTGLLSMEILDFFLEFRLGKFRNLRTNIGDGPGVPTTFVNELQ